MSTVIRRFACAEGRVQGVGFRMFVRQQAVMRDITGWVKNMSDGTVTMELQGAADAVEGGDLLPLGGEPHPDRSLQFGGVVGVQRLPGLEHHVVGDVHRKGNGTHPAGPQPVRHEPGCRGSRIEALNREGDEHTAAIRLQDNGIAVGNRGGQRQVVGVTERNPVDNRKFTAQSPQ